MQSKARSRDFGTLSWAEVLCTHDSNEDNRLEATEDFITSLMKNGCISRQHTSASDNVYRFALPGSGLNLQFIAAGRKVIFSHNCKYFEELFL